MSHYLYSTRILILGVLSCLVTCTPVKVPVISQYKLERYSTQRLATHPHPLSILVTIPEAAAGYQTEHMLYRKKPYELAPFTQNAWIDPPALMLLPLIVQSLESSHYFYVVTSNLTSEQTTYRLDTQLITLEQNFLTHPSTINLVVNVVLTHNPTNRLISSKLISESIKCPFDNPYGGVIAANQATKAITAKILQFVKKSIQ